MDTSKSEPPFQTMAERRAAGDKIISEAIALEIARQIVFEERGDDGLRAQIPFSITSSGEYWRVCGKDNDAVEMNEFNQKVPFGSLNMLISQYDGRIAELEYDV